MLTGGYGFIGSALTRYLFTHHPTYQIINLDSLTYAAIHQGELISPNYTFAKVDISSPVEVSMAFALMPKPDVVINLAAETHVDRSIASSRPFITANVLGVDTLLAECKTRGVSLFLQVSTDEVYGESYWPGVKESHNYHPNSPYSASKAAAEHLALSYYHTHGVPVRITRGSNTYGLGQYPEKLIPLSIKRLVNNQSIPIYGSGQQRRDWLHVQDHVRGILAVMEKGRDGEVYNLGGGNYLSNLQIAQTLQTLHGVKDRIEFVTDRPGHDKSYCINSEKAKNELGWEPTINFEDGLARTYNHYLELYKPQ